MKKGLLRKIGLTCLGFSMVLGIGIAVFGTSAKPTDVKAATSSYCLTAKTGTGDGSNISTTSSIGSIFADTTYASSVSSCNKAYYGGTSGIKLGTSSATGYVEFALTKAGKVSATTIVVNAKLYNSNKAATVNIEAGGVAGTAQSVTSSFGDYEFTINNSISTIKVSGSKYVWISSITVNYTVKTLSSIAVKTAPSKVSYLEGEYFNPAGLVITKTYTDTSTEDLAYDSNKDDFSFNPSTTTALATSNTSVTITYDEKNASQAITVNPIPKFDVTMYPNHDNIAPTIQSLGVIPANPFSWENHKFLSWNTSADGTGTTVSIGTSVTAATTIYAIWAHSVSTLDNPFTIEEAIVAIDCNVAGDKDYVLTGAFVKGIICQIDSYNTTYSSIQYWISDDGTETNMFEVYSGRNYNNTTFASIDDLSVGMYLVITGNIKKFNSTYEFDKSSYPVAIAENYSSFFLSDTDKVCDATTDNLEDLQEIWSDQETRYNALSDAEKAIVISSTASSNVKNALERYDYIVGKYNTSSTKNLTEYIGSHTVSYSSMNNLFANSMKTDTSVMIIVVVSTVSLLSIAAFVFIKRRKETN